MKPEYLSLIIIVGIVLCIIALNFADSDSWQSHWIQFNDLSVEEQVNFCFFRPIDIKCICSNWNDPDRCRWVWEQVKDYCQENPNKCKK